MDLPLPIPPIQVIIKLPVLQLPTLSIYTRKCTYACPTLPIRPALPFLHCVHMSVLYVCVSTPALQLDSSAPFF